MTAIIPICKYLWGNHTHWNLSFGIVKLLYIPKVQRGHLYLLYLTRIRADSLIGVYSCKCWAEPIGLFVNKFAFHRGELFLFRVWKTGKKLSLKKNKSVFHIPLHFRRVIFVATRLYIKSDIQEHLLLFTSVPQILTQYLVLCIPVFKKFNENHVLWFMFGIFQREANCLI